MNSPDDGSVNREKTCPLLLRMFYSSLKHNNVIDYSRGQSPNNELQVYTWLDATLKELASLVKQVNPDARKRGTIFDFALVSPDRMSSKYRMRELGVVCVGSPSDTDRIMLKDCQFTIGDMVDIAISPPSAYETSTPGVYPLGATVGGGIQMLGKPAMANAGYPRRPQNMEQAPLGMMASYGNRSNYKRPFNDNRFNSSEKGDDFKRTVVDTSTLRQSGDPSTRALDESRSLSRRGDNSGYRRNNR